MPLLPWIGAKWSGHRTVRIALMVSKSSGKTVFLTAVANHLANHNPEAFNLGGIGVHCDRTTMAGGKKEPFARFDFLGARTAYRNGEWPEKTSEPTVLSLPLALRNAKTGKQEDVLFEIMDIPGERVADFSMFGKSYRQWCAWMESELAGPGGSSPSYRSYLRESGKISPADPAAARSALFSAYREFLADEYESFSANIVPSTVKLEPDGTKHGGATRQAFLEAIRDVPLGIRDKKGVAREFVPVPPSFFDPGSPWKKNVHEFADAYGKYVKTVVHPLEKWLNDATKLYYLVDVPALLQAGPRAWSSERSYGEAAIGMLCRRRSGNLLKRLGTGMLGLLVRTRIHSVGVVATKADLILPDGRDNLGVLAGNLLANVLGDKDSRVFVCAAVCSTRETVAEIGGHRTLALSGRVVKADGTTENATWIPPSVPLHPPANTEKWRAAAAEGRFDYPGTLPFVDPELEWPTEHLGLNAVVKDMLSR